MELFWRWIPTQPVIFIIPRKLGWKKFTYNLNFFQTLDQNIHNSYQGFVLVFSELLSQKLFLKEFLNLMFFICDSVIECVNTGW